MSYDFTRLQLEFKEVCRNAGCPCTVPIKLNGRLTRTLGRVTYNRIPSSDSYIPSLVEFSKQLLETASDKSIKDVIYHEAAHYIVTSRTKEHHGHDSLFKAVCAEIGTSNDTPVTKVERTVSSDKLYKYVVFCENCHKMIGGYQRKCATINHLSSCSCRICRKGNLKLIQNW